MKFRNYSYDIYFKPAFKTTIQRLKFSIKLRWQRFFFGIAFTAISGKVIIPNAIEQLDITNSSTVLNKKSVIFRSALKNWTIAEKYRAQGFWHQGVAIQNEILNELYKYQEISDSNYYPPILGTTWSSNFGHIGQVGIHSLAQKLNILPGGTRTIIESSPTANFELFKEISKDFITIRQKSGERWTEMPSFWHISERMRIIKTTAGFMDFASLLNEIFSEKNKPILRQYYIELSDDYLTRSAELLENYGLPRSAKFVAFHHRQTSSRSDVTQMKIDSFFPSIKEITDNGIWVIRFGVSGMDFLPQIPMVIDLISKPGAGRDLNPYILSQSEFFLGQFSGPAHPPMAFGVPILGVNVTNIGQSVTNAPEGSKFLPKKYIKRNGELLALSQIFEKNLGYGQHLNKELKKLDLLAQPNSAEEILDGTKELLDYILSGKITKSKFTTKLAEIREYFKVPTSGDFSEKFLEKNQEWLQ
jgi:putative glycosyltransferase (TIGR04372 family)